jgi:TRAP-type C4-dicarboxylate transport system permease small subunit
VRNLFATLLVAVFGAIVLSGGAAMVPRAAGPGAVASDAALAFAWVFLAAMASLAMAFVGLLLMAEKPLQTKVREEIP